MNAKSTGVLIIDDDPLIRTLLVSALRKDCRVAVAAEGSEGFAKALEIKPDIAVIDVNMPGWDGLKTLEAFRAHPSLRQTKIIMLTADASKQTVMAAVRAGANDYLIKTSFSKADFYRKLNQLVPGTIPHAAGAADPRGAAIGPASTRASDSSGNASSSRPPHVAVARDSDTAHSEPALRQATPSHAENDPRLQVMIDGWE